MNIALEKAEDGAHGFDILIIGDGILGLMTAYMLAIEQPDARVCILGSDKQTGAATVAAGAMLGCFGEVTYSTIQSEYARKKFAINFQASQIWPHFLEEINEKVDRADQLSIKQGTFVILNARSGGLDSKNYDAMLSLLEQYQQPYTKEEAHKIRGLDPIDDCRPMQALYLPNEGIINPIQLLKNILAIIKKMPNITFLMQEVEKLVCDENKIHFIQTKDGKKIKTKHILIAAGAHSQALIDQIPEVKNRIPRTFAGTGCSVLIGKKNVPIHQLIRTPNRSFACGLHILPRDEETFYVGATNNVNLLPEYGTNVGAVHFLLQCVMEQINQGLHSAEILQLIIGNRPVTIDTFPLVGETSIPGLWVLTGTYRDGLHSAPILAKYIAKKILGQKEDVFENIFQPERRPFSVLSKKEAILDAVQHYMAGAYEHEIQLPRVGWDSMFEEMLHRKFEALYEELDMDFTLPTDFLLMFDKDRKKHIDFFNNYNKSIQ